MTAVIETSTWRFALVGTPNSGKTALFNALTGSRQKVANYPGVTVERKAGMLQTVSGHRVNLVDLPGTYSLRGRSPDEEITRDVVLGRMASESAPDLLLCVADATNLRVALRLVMELKRVGRPMLLILNMIDIARRRGIDIDLEKLSAELGVPVVTSTAVRRGGTEDLLARIDQMAASRRRQGHAQHLAAADARRPSRRAARGRPRHQGRHQCAETARHADRQGRWRAAASGGGPRHPVGALVRHVPGGVRLGEAADGPDPVRLRRARRTGPHRAARRPAGKLHPERRDLRRRLGDRVPAADPDPVPVHPAAGRPRLHGARGVPDGQDHGRRRPARPRLHSAAVELRLRDPRNHGDARDRQQARPPHHHPGRAADDLLGAHPGLYADHLGVHPRQDGVWLHGPARARHVRPLRRRHLQRARRVVHQQPLLPARRRHPAVHAGIARLQDSAAQERAARPLHPRHDVPEARRHHDLLDDGADLVPGVVPAAAGGRRRDRRSTTASPPSSANGWSR